MQKMTKERAFFAENMRKVNRIKKKVHSWALTNAEPHRSPRAPKGSHRRNHWVRRGGVTWRKPSRLCSPTTFSIFRTMTCDHHVGGPRGLWPWRVMFLLTRPDFSNQHNKTRPAPLTGELRVGAFLTCAGLSKTAPSWAAAPVWHCRAVEP